MLAELLERQQNGEEGVGRTWTGFTEQLDYKPMLQWLEDLTHIMPYGARMRVTAHSLRSTYYLFKCLGGASEADSQKGARHKSKDMAEKYYQDSSTFRQLLIDNGSIAFMPLYTARNTIVDGPNVARVIASQTGIATIRTIKEAATFFVENMLHVSPNDGNYRNAGHLLRLSYQDRHLGEQGTSQSIESQLMGWVNQPHITLQQKQGILSIFQQWRAMYPRPAQAPTPVRRPQLASMHQARNDDVYLQEKWERGQRKFKI